MLVITSLILQGQRRSEDSCCLFQRLFGRLKKRIQRCLLLPWWYFAVDFAAHSSNNTLLPVWGSRCWWCRWERAGDDSQRSDFWSGSFGAEAVLSGRQRSGSWITVGKKAVLQMGLVTEEGREQCKAEVPLTTQHSLKESKLNPMTTWKQGDVTVTRKTD